MKNRKLVTILIFLITLNIFKLDLDSSADTYRISEAENYSLKLDDKNIGNKSAIDLLEQGKNFHGQYYLNNNTSFLIKALETLNKSIEINKNLPMAYYWKALTQVKLNRFNEAIKTLTDEVSHLLVQKEGVYLFFLRGVLYQKQKSIIKAMENYETVKRLLENKLRENPNSWEDTLLLLQTLCLQGKKNQALTYINSKIHKDPNNKMLIQIQAGIKDFDPEQYIKNL